MTYKFTNDGAAVVSPFYKWLEIDEDTPENAMMLLINKNSGVLHKGMHSKFNTFFTHWAALPTFSKDTK